MLRTAWRWFVARPEPDDKLMNIISWWEIRRIPYNVIVGLGAVASFALFFMFILASGELGPGEDAVEPLGLLMAVIIANICYTAGWVVELILRSLGRLRKWMAPALFVSGTLFSLLVVGLPADIWGIECLAHGIARYDVPHSDMIGAYEVTHDQYLGVNLGTDRLILKADGTFGQVFTPSKGKGWRSTGRWRVEQDADGHTMAMLDGRTEALDQDGGYRLRPHPAPIGERLAVDRRRAEVRIHVDSFTPSYRYRKIR